MSTSPRPVVTTTSVSKRWGTVQALDDVDIVIPPGVTGLLGANGAGKTTLLGMLLGFYPPETGSVTVLGQDPHSFGPQVRARLGYAPEHDALPGEIRAQDFVRYVAELHGLPRQAAMTRASDTLNLVGLGEERMRQIGTMSQGQKQRVKIAQAIAHDPELVLLDEPTNGLDPLQRDDMLATIRRIGHDLGIHVVVSSHLIHEVERICDSVVVLESGRLKAAGEVAGMLGAGATMVIEVGDGADRLVGALAEAAVAARPVGPGLVAFETAGDDRYDVIRDTVADLGLPLRRLERQTVSLTERFFADLPPPVVPGAHAGSSGGAATSPSPQPPAPPSGPRHDLPPPT